MAQSEVASYRNKFSKQLCTKLPFLTTECLLWDEGWTFREAANSLALDWVSPSLFTWTVAATAIRCRFLWCWAERRIARALGTVIQRRRVAKRQHRPAVPVAMDALDHCLRMCRAGSSWRE